eukprot:2356052-Pyramimonas_sp.AAC.1
MSYQEYADDLLGIIPLCSGKWMEDTCKTQRIKRRSSTSREQVRHGKRSAYVPMGLKMVVWRGSWHQLELRMNTVRPQGSIAWALSDPGEVRRPGSA